MSLFVQQNSSVCSFHSSNSWVVLSPIEHSIKQKIETIGTPLKDWDIQINYGIKTGFNDAFIISTEKREQLLAACQTPNERKRTEELIRPILRGRDIKRYSYDWAELWLINTHNGIKGKIDPININDYPAIKHHLDNYWDKISNRDDQGVTPYNLRNCAYLEEFSKPKIIWKRIGSILRFSYDEAGVVGLDSTCFATGQFLAYVCCVLNSKMGHYLLKDAPKTGTGDLLISVQAVDPIRIPFPPEHLDYLEGLLKAQIQDCTDENDKLIDEFVYNLYNLNTEEIAFVNDFVTEFE